MKYNKEQMRIDAMRYQLKDTKGCSTEFFRSGNKDQDIRELLDMAYDLVELWDVEQSPYNQRIKHCWMKRAKELGAIPSW